MAFKLEIMIPVETFRVDTLSVYVYNSEAELAEGAARMGQEYLQAILTQKAMSAVLLATGNSQIQFLQALASLGGIEWSRSILFHLDEYLGIEANATGSFRYYLRERIEKPVKPAQFHYIEGDTLEPLIECDRYSKLLMAQAIDLCMLGIGQNGHLAFNEPEVADFKDPHRVKLVKLAMQTRQAQVDQGYFPHLETVPQYAFTVTIPMMASAQKIICLAPGRSKASIIKKMLTDAIAPTTPASFLRQHANATLFLDKNSASLL
jgi:glucosamine-6-phosphate deaminase